MKLVFNPRVDSVLVAGTEIAPQSWETVDENNPKVQKALDAGKIVIVDTPEDARVNVTAEAVPLLDKIDEAESVDLPMEEPKTSQDAEVRNTGSKQTQRGSAKKTSKE